MLEYILLGFLIPGEKTGYELKQCMVRSTSYFFDASFGSIYPALKRLTDKGMILLQQGAEGSRVKKSYEITEAGKTCFLDWLAQPIPFAGARQDHLVKLFFYGYLPKETAVQNLKEFITEVEVLKNRLEREKQEEESQHAISEFFYEHAAMIYGVTYYHFVIDWCRTLIRQLEGEDNQ